MKHKGTVFLVSLLVLVCLIWGFREFLFSTKVIILQSEIDETVRTLAIKVQEFQDVFDETQEWPVAGDLHDESSMPHISTDVIHDTRIETYGSQSGSYRVKIRLWPDGRIEAWTEEVLY